MGGCCCFFSRRAELRSRSPVYYYCPQSLDEHSSLSTQGTASTVSTTLLVDTNLETSFPDSYRAPPAPLPFDLAMGISQTSPGTLENSGSGCETVVACESLKDSDYKNEVELVLGSQKTCEAESFKLAKPLDEEDVCPTCFEGYDSENPRIITKCDHHFHLSCILEWLERSDSCPICDQEMIFNHNSDG